MIREVKWGIACGIVPALAMIGIMFVERHRFVISAPEVAGVFAGTIVAAVVAGRLVSRLSSMHALFLLAAGSGLGYGVLVAFVEPLWDPPLGSPHPPSLQVFAEVALMCALPAVVAAFVLQVLLPTRSSARWKLVLLATLLPVLGPNNAAMSTSRITRCARISRSRVSTAAGLSDGSLDFTPA